MVVVVAVECDSVTINWARDCDCDKDVNNDDVCWPADGLCF